MERGAKRDIPSAVVSACVFCRIVAGTGPADMIFEDGRIMAFLDIRPVFKGHTLVIPREHVVTLPELSEELLHPLFSGVHRVATAVETALGAHGSFIAVNNGVSQSVPHLHVHVMPRRRGDLIRKLADPRRRYSSADEAREYAARLRAALNGG